MRSDSDVDVAVQCHEASYWSEQSPGYHPSGGQPYSGIWTPTRLRSEIKLALEAKFPDQIDSSGSVAFRVNSNVGRVDADVVPSFDFRHYLSATSYREGSKVFRRDGSSVENYPQQQLDNGIAKNNRTGRSFKRAVRIMKRVENAMVNAGTHREVQSYFVECLVYNCPDKILNASTWVDTVKGVIYHVWSNTEGAEPTGASDRWLEVSECKYLFHSSQPWSREDARDFSNAAWQYMGLGS